MSSDALKFVHISGAPIDDLMSTVLEVYIGDNQLADIYCADGEWYISLMTENGLKRIPLNVAVQIIAKFSEFVLQENKIIWNEIKDENNLSSED